ncbi:MAG: hypothetical protein WKG06_08640 [Segetibacter sp.]
MDIWLELASRPGIPSIITNGAELPGVPLPLMRIDAASLPGSPDLCCMIAPGSRPAKALDTLETGADAISLPDIVATEPITFTFLSLPYPTTTTSSNEVLLAVMVMVYN